MLASLLMVLCLQMAAQTWEDVKVGTSTRKTLTYVPKNVEKSPALVISLHGMNQDPEYQQNQTQWNALAGLSLPGNAWLSDCRLRTCERCGYR